MGEEKVKSKKEYEISISSDNEVFKIKINLNDLQFKKFIYFLMNKR